MAALALAVEIDGDGSHPASWRRAPGPPDHQAAPDRLRRLGETVERAGFTAVTIDDELLPPAPGIARLGAVERAAFLAEVTSVIGLVPVLATTYSEPFHVSSSLAALDHISHGRAGWIVTASADTIAGAWGRPPVADDDARRREARDAVEVSRALWDSWEDDAVIRDVSTSRYLDRDRVHYVDFEGATYGVKGPATVPRPPQGNVVVLGDPDLVSAPLLDVALVRAANVTALAGAAAAVTTPRRFAEVEVALDTPEASGADRVADLDRDGAWPDRSRVRHVGPADGLVRLLADVARHVDGVRLHPLVLDEDLPVLSRLVIPRLLVERVSARPVAGHTLRATLGLARPANRFAATTAITTAAAITIEG